MSFWGFPRPDGSVGTRNHVGVIATVTCANDIAQWISDQVPGCGPGFEYIMENFALFDALELIFQGSGECADVVWRMLGLSMPSWVIIGLGGLGIAGIWNNLRGTG